MSQNFNEPYGTTPGTTGGAGTGATDAGTTRDTSTSMTPGTTGPTPGGGGQATGAATATAQGLAAQAQEYGQRIAGAATQAKDYVTDKVSVVGDKIKDLQNTDIRQVAEDAKEYTKQNPGQALLISAAAGFLIGLLLRTGRR
jgi:ElaB/YqjD/DUF883 family membrane-anchored ribosome-binding protein